MGTALRVVGECQCMEHQANGRLREIITELQAQVKIANECIATLRRELTFEQGVDYDPEVTGDPDPAPGGSAGDEEEKGGEEDPNLSLF